MDRTPLATFCKAKHVADSKALQMSDQTCTTKETSENVRNSKHANPLKNMTLTIKLGFVFPRGKMQIAPRPAAGTVVDNASTAKHAYAKQRATECASSSDVEVTTTTQDDSL